MTLLRANLIFVAANLLHTADHQRQGTGGLSWEILAGGSAISIAAIASLVLATVAAVQLRRASSPEPRAAVRAAAGRSTL
jgi:hypothetical protein